MPHRPSALVPAFLGSRSRFDLTRACASLNSFSIASSVSLASAESAAIICDAARLPLAKTFPSWSIVRAASAASSEERLADCRMALIWDWASIIAGAAAATKAPCVVRSASYCFSCWAAMPSRSFAAEPRLLMLSSMFLTVSVSAATTFLSAPSSMISPSFCSVTVLGLAHLLGAFVQRLLAFGGKQRRSLACKARALGGKLQAGRQARDVLTAQIDHAPAEMAEHHGRAGADDERQARDDREGGEQAAPDAPSRPQEADEPAKLADRQSPRHVVPARKVPWDGSFGRQYRVTRLIKSLRFTGLARFPRTENTTKRPARGRPFRSCNPVNGYQYFATTGPPQLKR